MGLTAAAGIAVAAWCAVVAAGGASLGPVELSPATYALGLIPGLVLAARREPRLILQSLVARVGGWGLTASLFLFYAVLGGDVGRYVDTAFAAMPFAVLALSLLWPSPTALVPSALLAAGALLASDAGVMEAPLPVLGVVAGLATALVALQRVRLPGRVEGAPGGVPAARRLGREAAVVAVVIGLAGLAAAALLPPASSRSPSGPGDRLPSAPGRGGADPVAGPTPLAPAPELDLTDPQAGRGPGGPRPSTVGTAGGGAGRPGNGPPLP